MMRTLLRVFIDAQAGNKAMNSGKLPDVIKKTMETLQPEAAYFLPSDGERSCLMVFDLKDPSQIPMISEPFFNELNARVEFTPVMNAEDLQKGIQMIQKKELVVEQ
jgi:hypothetical protein